MPNQKNQYTKEGLPVVSQEVSNSVLEYLSVLKTNPLENMQKMLELRTYLKAEQGVLRIYGQVGHQKIMRGDTIGVPHPSITFRIGFFETYQLFRRQGEMEKGKNTRFRGLPVVSHDAIMSVIEEFDRWDEEGKYEERYHRMLDQIRDSNGILYRQGINQMNNLTAIDSGMTFMTGFMSVIELLREQQKRNTASQKPR